MRKLDDYEGDFDRPDFAPEGSDPKIFKLYYDDDDDDDKDEDMGKNEIMFYRHLLVENKWKCQPCMQLRVQRWTR